MENKKISTQCGHPTTKNNLDKNEKPIFLLEEDELNYWKDRLDIANTAFLAVSDELAKYKKTHVSIYEKEIEQLKKKIESMKSYRDHRIHTIDTQKEEIERLKSDYKLASDSSDKWEEMWHEMRGRKEKALKHINQNSILMMIEEELTDEEEPVNCVISSEMEEILGGK